MLRPKFPAVYNTEMNMRSDKVAGYKIIRSWKSESLYEVSGFNNNDLYYKQIRDV